MFSCKQDAGDALLVFPCRQGAIPACITPQIMEETMVIQSVLASGLEKIFPAQAPAACRIPFTMLKNDTFSFQVALRPVNMPEAAAGDALSSPAVYPGDSTGTDASIPVRISVTSPIAAQVSLRRVDLMPSTLPVNDTRDGNFISDRPGLYPDLLTPLEDGTCSLPCDMWTAFWIEIETNENTSAGSFPVTIAVESDRDMLYLNNISGQNADDTEHAELLNVSDPPCELPEKKTAILETQIDIIDAVLPKQQLIVTEWFHGDCIADYYKIPVFSETHWEYMRRQIRLGVRRGLNMILTPIFTPPLDTEPGGERTTIQLVGIEYKDGVYSFDFSKLERWVTMCQDCGIEYFEMAHLYTQWGAAHCPKIMVTENGVLKKRFGWDNDALGEDYRQFLNAFLPALTGELRRLGIGDRTIFHISDEPDEASLSQYQAAKAQVSGLLAGFPVMDAMSHYRYFTDGICETPIIATDALEPFLAGRRPADLWVYYCCAQNYRVSNRFFGMPSARNRIIGLQLYQYQVSGFLQWGFNFYNSQLSRRHIDPFAVTDADGAFPSGDSFLVYPGPDGEPLESLHMAVFYEALCDLRALRLLERLTSREHVLSLMEDGLDEPLTFTAYPRDAEFLLRLRERVNREIAEYKTRNPLNGLVFCADTAARK